MNDLRGGDLLQQGDGGDRIDGLIEANLCRHRFDVDGAVDVQPLTTRVALEVHRRATLDPPATQHRIVQRVGGIHEQDHIALLLVFLELAVGFDMGFLTFGIRFARNQLRFLIRYTPAGAAGRSSR